MKLRDHLVVMLVAHSVFLTLEIFFYRFSILLVGSETFYLWLCYYSYMTLSNCAMYFYIFFMLVAPLSGFFHLFDFGISLSTLIYMG